MALVPFSTVTLSAFGTVTGDFIAEWRNPGVAQPRWKHNSIIFQTGYLGAVVFAKDRSGDIPGSVRHYDVTCYTGPGIGAGNSDAGSVEMSFPTAGTTTWTVPLAGNWLVTAPVEQCYEIVGSNFPTYGGTAFDDLPFGGTCNVVERLLVGGTLSVSANIAGVSVSASTVIASASTADYAVRTSGTVEAWGKNVSANIVLQWARNGTIELTAPLSASDANHSHSAATGAAPFAATDGNRTLFDSVLYAPRAYNYEAVNRVFDLPYSGTVTYLLDRSGSALAGTVNSNGGGTLSDSNTQYRYSADCTFQTSAYTDDLASGVAPRSYNAGTAHSVLLEQWAAFRAWVSPVWAIANNHDPRDWRSLMRIMPGWIAGSIVQAGSVTLYSSAGSAGAGSVSVSLPDSSTDATLQGTAWSGASLSGYRYVEVEAKNSSAVATNALTMNDKTWQNDYLGNALSFGTAFSKGTIDTLCPDGGGADEDGTDTRFPLTLPAPVTPTEGPLYGVNTATSTTLATSSGTVTLKALKPIRRVHSKISLIPTFDNWVSAGDGSEYRIDFLRGDTDYRKSLEGIDGYRNGGNVTQRGIGQILQSVAGSAVGYPADGWSVAGTPGSADAYRNDNAPATFLGGAGAVYSGGNWTYWYNTAATASIPLYAQVLADTIGTWPPDCGDVFGFGGSSSGSIQLRAAKFFRFGAWGAALQEGIPYTGATVILTDLTDSVAGGTAIVDANGGYYSGTPFVRGNHSARVQLDAEQFIVTTPGRKMWRVGFCPVGSADSRGVAYAVNGAGRHAVAFGCDGTICMGMNTDAFGLTYGSVDTGILGTPTCLMWDRGRENRLYLLYGDGGSIFLQYTKTEGATWTMAGTIATSGTAGRSVYTRDGRKYYFWQDGGALYSRVYDSTDTAFGTAFPIVNSGVDNDTIDCDEWTANKGQWRLNVHYRSSGNLITVTTSDGQNYS